jgi:heme-degrading monooxygenase HmoA
MKAVPPDRLLGIGGSDFMPRIEKDSQAVTQITLIEVEPDKQQEALSLMTERAHFMARQPGFISISLHRSLDGRRIVNYIQWQNRELLQAAHKSPDFRKAWQSSTI